MNDFLDGKFVLNAQKVEYTQQDFEAALPCASKMAVHIKSAVAEDAAL